MKKNISRRELLSALSAAALSSNINITRIQIPEKEIDIIKPPALKKGDCIGIIAPAGNVETQEDLNLSKDIVEWLGFKPVFGKNILNQYGYLAGKDNERADDVNEMFANKNVQGIICLRGGYGTMRILPFIDYDNIKHNLKVIMGFSDITGLLLAIYKKTGLVTFHGPVTISTFNEYTMEYLKKAIFINKPVGEVSIPKKNPNYIETENRLIKLGKGKASGILIGGNLSLYTGLLGTPYDIDAKGKLLFFEDVGEEAYRIDRMLTQLWLCGKLNEYSGILIGKLTDSKPKTAGGNSLSMEEVIRTRIEPLKIPALYGHMIGHIKDKVTIPIGIKASINADSGEFIIEESAVS